VFHDVVLYLSIIAYVIWIRTNQLVITAFVIIRISYSFISDFRLSPTRGRQVRLARKLEQDRDDVDMLEPGKDPLLLLEECLGKGRIRCCFWRNASVIEFNYFRGLRLYYNFMGQYVRVHFQYYVRLHISIGQECSHAYDTM
jgi:hypothetical protein